MAGARITQICDEVALSLGYATLKEEQQKVIEKFVEGEDVFAALPTGYGKSLCYVCLPRIYDRLYGTSNSVAVVITPLTAIMKDQVCFNYILGAVRVNCSVAGS